ncbi:progonadoliberin-1 [Pithys albifrons albifrons]|uniref:progonadoliberin-1 n=1 Tax=Pithys albifrons albifrons TaxID=3385563 RepID=UPI003A5CCE44
MEKSKKTFASVLLLVLCVGTCLAQHWSFGLQPGGKRSTRDLLGPFQEVAEEVEEPVEGQQLQCPGWAQHSGLRDLQGALEKLLEGEGRRKI